MAQQAILVMAQAYQFADHGNFAAGDFALDGRARVGLVEKVRQSPDEVMRLQTEFLKAQMQAMAEQAQELGQSASKAAMEAAKPKF